MCRLALRAPAVGDDRAGGALVAFASLVAIAGLRGRGGEHDGDDDEEFHHGSSVVDEGES